MTAMLSIAALALLLVPAATQAGGPNDQPFTRMVTAQQAGGTGFSFRRQGRFEPALAEPSKGTATNKATGSPPPSLDRTAREAIIQAAGQAVRKHLVSGTREPGGAEIPKAMWGKAIEQLQPLRVLNDKANVFIVLKEDNATEEGLYASIPISSYAPGLDDRFLLFEKLSQPGDEAFGQLYKCKLKKLQPTP